MKNRLHKCCMCGNRATWKKGEHIKGEAIYYCDECVPRGDVSNVENIEEWDEPIQNALVMWWDRDCVKKDLEKDGSTTRTEKSFYYEYLNYQGKRNPSIKYSNDINGFPINDKYKATITTDDILEAMNKHKFILRPLELKSISTSIAEVLVNYETCTNVVLPYNTFMSQFGDKIKNKCNAIGYQNNIKRFYNRFKKELTTLKYEKG